MENVKYKGEAEFGEDEKETEEVLEMTVEQVIEKLGYDIKIIK